MKSIDNGDNKRVGSLGVVSGDIETHLFPESVRALPDGLSPDVLVVINRGSNVRRWTATPHAGGDGESGNFVVDVGHRVLAR